MFIAALDIKYHADRDLQFNKTLPN